MLSNKTTQRRIDAYRRDRDAYLAARDEWHGNFLKSGESWEGKRRKKTREALEWMLERIAVLEDLEGIDHRDIDRLDGIINPIPGATA